MYIYPLHICLYINQSINGQTNTVYKCINAKLSFVSPSSIVVWCLHRVEHTGTESTPPKRNYCVASVICIHRTFAHRQTNNTNNNVNSSANECRTIFICYSILFYFFLLLLSLFTRDDLLLFIFFFGAILVCVILMIHFHSSAFSPHESHHSFHFHLNINIILYSCQLTRHSLLFISHHFILSIFFT